MDLLRRFQFTRLTRNGRVRWRLTDFGTRFGWHGRIVSTMIRAAVTREKRSIRLPFAGFAGRPHQHRLEQDGSRHSAGQGESHQLAHAR